MGFFGKFFVAIFAVCAARGAWANCTCQWDTCDDNEYCNVIVSYPYPGNPEYSYECTPCPSGQVPSNSCLTCVPAGGGQYCDSFEENCPGLGLEYRCKIIDQDCGSGCKKYQSCNSINGNLGPDVVSENCHIEGQTCYTNTRACSEFSNEIINQGMGCNAVSQLNYQAEWQDNKWDAINCKCEVENADTEFLFRCKQLNLHASVQPANRYLSSASSKIRYTLDYMYCGKCYPGYLPDYQNSPYNGANIRPSNISGNWGVVACLIEVIQPYYAEGCVIDFSLPTGAEAYNDCRKECPVGSATESDGAQSIDDCITDYSQTYEDGTGWFVLGGFETCP